jgi:hypothetical protein
VNRSIASIRADDPERADALRERACSVLYDSAP